LGICMNSLLAVTMRLPRTCGEHPVSNRLRVFRDASIAVEFTDCDRRHLDVDIQAVLERTRKSRSIPTDLLRCAEAVPCRIAIVPARTRIHSCNQHESRWIAERAAGSRQDDMAVFKRLPEAIQNWPPELGRLIQEEDAVMSQRDLSGTWDRSSSNESRVRNAVMRCPKWAHGEECPVGRYLAMLGTRVVSSPSWDFISGRIGGSRFASMVLRGQEL